MTLLLTDGGRQARAQALSTVLRAHLQRRLDLPPSLRPWGAQLSVLPTALALSIGPWLPRLAQAVGPLATEVTATTGEPQGYGGLARRGPYDRLLLGEWLLADELPDEFLRRAIDGEHVFYELSHRAPVDRRRVVVLFDGGPQQLGGPRIAQLALLLLFARRAEAAGADLAWGVLQDPQRRLLDGATRSSVEHLLDGSSALGVEDELLERWCQTLAASGGPDARSRGRKAQGAPGRPRSRSRSRSIVSGGRTSTSSTSCQRSRTPAYGPSRRAPGQGLQDQGRGHRWHGRLRRDRREHRRSRRQGAPHPRAAPGRGRGALGGVPGRGPAALSGRNGERAAVSCGGAYLDALASYPLCQQW